MGNRVNFYLKPKQDDEATIKEGRPIFKMSEYVTISTGDRLNEVNREVRPEDRAVYRAQYDAFKADKDQDVASGTLLSATGLFPPERIEELAYFKYRTVEQFAGASDDAINRLGLHALADRQKCIDFISSAKSNVPLLRLQSQLESQANENATLKQQLSHLQASVDSLRGLRAAPAPASGLVTAPVELAPPVNEALETGPLPDAPKKRGRPKKQSETVEAG